MSHSLDQLRCSYYDRPPDKSWPNQLESITNESNVADVEKLSQFLLHVRTFPFCT